jgi:hypothetical protein
MEFWLNFIFNMLRLWLSAKMISVISFLYAAAKKLQERVFLPVLPGKINIYRIKSLFTPPRNSPSPSRNKSP